MKRKIRIAHIITRLIIGGAQENTILTVEGLKKKGDYEVVLITGPSMGPEGSLVEEAERREIKPIIVESLRRDIYPWLDVKSLFTLYFLIRRGNYHLVHTHSTKAGILGRLVGWVAGVPLIIHTVHGLPFFPHQNRFINFCAVNLERLVAPFTDKIITVCNAMAKKDYFVRRRDRNKFITIYSGMELDKFLYVKENKDLKKKLHIKEGELVVGKIARLFELKGHRFLLKSIGEVTHRFPHVKFLFLGDGILKNELKDKVHELGIENNVIFAGLIQRDKIPEYLSIMDIVVHTSLREGLARVIPQAFASGKPVIAFSVDGAEEIIEDKRSGFLIPPPMIPEKKWRNYDCGQLTSSLVRLLEDEGLRKRMGEEGRKRVHPIFKIEYMVERIDALYKELLKKKRIIS